jgi:hypothetical protein
MDDGRLFFGGCAGGAGDGLCEPRGGDRLIARAIDDRNRDGACSAGEAWAEVETAINDDDSTDAIALVLSAEPCP